MKNARSILVSACASAWLAACATTTADEVETTEIAPSDLPASVVKVISAERPEFSVEEVLKKVRDGRIYYDVEGELSDGSELEFDVLMTDAGAQIVEIQRALDWGDVPADIKAIALEASDGAEPVRIIESLQTDGAVIYELFAEGQPADPAWEVRLYGGQAELLTERWMH